MNPLRQPVSFLKSFDKELREGNMTQETVKQRLSLVEANTDTVADILTDNISLQGIIKFFGKVSLWVRKA